MAQSEFSLLIADCANPWREALVRLLRESDREGVKVTTIGHELYMALADPSGPKVCVIGQMLDGLGAEEALFLARESLVQERQSRQPGDTASRAIFMVAEGRSDAELLDLLRRRGVTDFIYRDDPLERTAAALLKSRFVERRPNLRVMVRLEARARIGAETLECAMYDLSPAGAQLLLSADRHGPPIELGQKLVVECGLGELHLTLPSEIRRTGSRKGAFSERLVLGVSFDPMPDAQKKALEHLLDMAVEELELARRG